MSSSTDFNQLKETIEAIKEEQVLFPDVPIDSYHQEAENLYISALKDKEALTKRGLSIEVIETLSVANGACRFAQSEWNRERTAKQQSEKDWKENSPMAYELRDDLIYEFEYAFDGNSDLLSIVDRVRTDRGHADMIQDLMDLYALGKENTNLLQATNFDVSLLNKAESTSDNMADLLALANGAKNETNKAKVMRDKAYTYLKYHVDAVRKCGKFVFRKDKNRKEMYMSAYYRKH
jgi:hypothetical protein